MRNNVKKIIALAAIALTGAILFAQTEADYTILEDREITHTDWDSIIYDQSYINNVKKLTKITKKNMNRERYATIPEELERGGEPRDAGGRGTETRAGQARMVFQTL